MKTIGYAGRALLGSPNISLARLRERKCGEPRLPGAVRRLHLCTERGPVWREEMALHPVQASVSSCRLLFVASRMGQPSESTNRHEASGMQRMFQGSLGGTEKDAEGGCAACDETLRQQW